ncbi:MAG: SagB/ThcOx family dehydrogenase [Bacteroidales bacterium]
MKKQILIPTMISLFFTFGACSSPSAGNSADNLEGKLPDPKHKGRITLEETLKHRESVRQFENKPLTIEQISQLLWAAQGISHSWGDRTYRTAPSAGATYPLETYLFTKSGGYKYDPENHSLTKSFDKDLRQELSDVALGQTSVSDAHAVIVFTMIEERTAQRYEERAFRYVCMEAGHAAQNIHLQAVAFGLGSVPVGAFDDNELAKLLECSEEEKPLYIIPVGFQAQE